MSALTTEPASLARRGEAYTELVALVARRGDAALHSPERELLFDAADALLFGEEGAQEKQEGADEMFRSLSESGRWTEGAAEEVASLLQLIGA